jgi:hypothetical protein
MNLNVSSMKKERKILPFRRNIDASSSDFNYDDLLDQIFGKEDNIREFKSIIESAVLDAHMKNNLYDLKRVDDPFDAIYFSELMPDRLKLADINKISTYSGIVDLSDSISFDDGWDD